MNAAEFQKEVLEQLALNRKFQENTVEFQKTVIDQLVRLTQEVAEVRQSQVRIENEHGEKIKALFDAQEVVLDKMERFNESQARIEDKLDRLTLKVSAHETILKRVK